MPPQSADNRAAVGARLAVAAFLLALTRVGQALRPRRPGKKQMQRFFAMLETTLRLALDAISFSHSRGWNTPWDTR